MVLNEFKKVGAKFFLITYSSQDFARVIEWTIGRRRMGRLFNLIQCFQANYFVMKESILFFQVENLLTVLSDLSKLRFLCFFV